METYFSRAIALDNLPQKLPRVTIREGALGGVYCLRTMNLEVSAPKGTPLVDLLWLLRHEACHWRQHALGGGPSRTLEEYEAEEQVCDTEAGRATGLSISPLLRKEAL